jgi:Undecaprenyl-phosphate glucose phosphotransferase
MKPRLDQLTSATRVDISKLADSMARMDKALADIGHATKPFLAPHVVVALVKMIEGLFIALVGFALVTQYPGLQFAVPPVLYISLIAGAAILLPLILQTYGLYRLASLLNPLSSLPRLVLSWITLFAILAVGVLATKTGISLSRGFTLNWLIFGLGFLIAVRFGIAAFIRHYNNQGQFNRRAIIVGGGTDAETAISTLQNSHDTGVTLLGYFDDRDDVRSPVETRGLHKLGSMDDLLSFVRRTRVDTLIVTLPVTAEQRLMQILDRLWVLPVDIRISAHGQKLRYRPRAYSHIGNLALLDVFDKPLGDWGPLLKSIEDRVIASVALALLSPIMALVALAIKLDSKGPVLFKQNRFGFNNELIGVYKFRSMYTDMTDHNATTLATKGDPRVTKVGRFIRRTSLDELPQLFNVLIGNLSLVGPRPHATKASAAGALYENAVQGYFARHRVKPGMTGWAQINGWRGETDTAEKIQRRVEHDLHYIENWSLTFDLYILARTPLALMKSEGAY